VGGAAVQGVRPHPALPGATEQRLRGGEDEVKMAEDVEPELIAEQLRHTIDLLRGEIAALRMEQGHIKELSNHRLAQLESSAQDHETRIRGLTDGVTQFKVWLGLASGGSGLVSLVAFVRAWFGG
jgi:hypothetical protein